MGLVEKWREPSYAYRDAPLDSEPEKYYDATKLKCADELEARDKDLRLEIMDAIFMLGEKRVDAAKLAFDAVLKKLGG